MGEGECASALDDVRAAGVAAVPSPLRGERVRVRAVFRPIYIGAGLTHTLTPALSHPMGEGECASALDDVHAAGVAALPSLFEERVLFSSVSIRVHPWLSLFLVHRYGSTMFKSLVNRHHRGPRTIPRRVIRHSLQSMAAFSELARIPLKGGRASGTGFVQLAIDQDIESGHGDVITR